MRNASWALANMCRGSPPPKFSTIEKAVPALAKVLLENGAEDILVDISWAFSYMSDSGEEQI